MPAGRPPLGSSHVNSLDGPEELKQRLRVLLDSLSGACTIDEACRVLGVSAARLHEMRHQALAGALAALAPGRPGRPARQPEPGETRIRELEHELDEAKVDLQAARTRLEIALVMPHVLRSAADGKKNETQAKARRGKRRRRRQRGGT